MKKLTIETLRRIVREEVECMSQDAMRLNRTTRPDPLADLYDDDMLPEDPLDDINCLDCGEYLDVDDTCPVCGPHPPSRRIGESRLLNEGFSFKELQGKNPEAANEWLELCRYVNDELSDEEIQELANNSYFAKLKSGKLVGDGVDPFSRYVWTGTTWEEKD